MATFSERLKEIRKARGVTQKTAAQFLGITEQAYQKYEYAMREPDHETTISLAEFYQISIDYLMGRTEDTAMFRADVRVAEVLSDTRLSLTQKGLYMYLVHFSLGSRTIMSNVNLFLQEHNLAPDEFEILLNDLAELKYLYIIDHGKDDITNQRQFILL
ncbi:MAG: helix-turn-helix domain-containing protein [Defluviitaleaceae bacterium]|nr:helix-turn-helix domain-containing protein [Defluviitaleaceae bacterium]MCL2239449.1 helix-turn-helix domain-containing protein [Defluviitaleaceae bacterium]